MSLFPENMNVELEKNFLESNMLESFSPNPFVLFVNDFNGKLPIQYEEHIIGSSVILSGYMEIMNVLSSALRLDMLAEIMTVLMRNKITIIRFYDGDRIMSALKKAYPKNVNDDNFKNVCNITVKACKKVYAKKMNQLFKFINGDSSDDILNKLYDLIAEAVSKPDDKSDGKSDDSKKAKKSSASKKSNT